jgi:hypothetical protein
VAISLGPAPEGEVLAAIFGGSKFDFVAMGRPDSPGIVQRVILTHKSQPGAVAGAQPPAQANNGQGDDEEVPDETVNAGDPQDTPVQPVPVPQAQQPQIQNEQPRTQEQLLQELQQMREKQLQQLQQGQTPAQVPRKPPL